MLVPLLRAPLLQLVDGALVFFPNTKALMALKQPLGNPEACKSLEQAQDYTSDEGAVALTASY